MRHQGDSTSGRSASRPRDPGSGSAPGRRGRSAGNQPSAGRGAVGAPTAGPATGRQNGEQSVFVPGYRRQRPGGASHGSDALPDGVPWPSPAGDGHYAKGPARGFPPAPGQPPLQYPGQFAAWNRGPFPGGAGDPGLAGGSGVATAVPEDDGAWPSDAGGDWGQPDQPWYVNGDQGHGSGQLPWAAGGPPAVASAPPGWGDASPDAAGGPGGAAAGAWPYPDDQVILPPARPAGPASPSGQAPAAADIAEPGSPATPPMGSPVAPVPPASPGSPPGGGRSRGARSRPTARGTGKAAATQPGTAKGGAVKGGAVKGGAAKSSAAKGRTGRGRGRPSALLAVCAVVILAVAAVAFLWFTARHQSPSSASAPSSSPPKTTSPTPSSTPTPSLGPYGHIVSRAADPAPLTIAQLFPAGFKVRGHSFTRVAAKQGKSCAGALIGTRLRTAAKAAKCTQVARASYVGLAIHVMGTIGVLNLTTVKNAEHVGHAAGAADFIAQLKAHKGVARMLGKGTGIEEATVKGHYLILMWAQFVTRHRPRTKAQRSRLENFMTNMFQQTVNVSLTSRMVDGTP